MGKGIAGRWLELHRPSPASAITVVLLLSELTVGHGVSKTSPNKIKSPWYVPSASHPLYHQHALHPYPLRHASRRTITAPTRTSTPDTAVAHHVLFADLRHPRDHPHHRFVRLLESPFPNPNLACCASRRSTSNTAITHLTLLAALCHLHIHPHDCPVRHHRCLYASRVCPQVHEEAEAATVRRRCLVRQGFHRCKSHALPRRRLAWGGSWRTRRRWRSTQTWWPTPRASGRRSRGCTHTWAPGSSKPSSDFPSALGPPPPVPIRGEVPAASVWTELVGSTSLWVPRWVSCLQSTMVAGLQCSSEGRWWLGLCAYLQLQDGEVLGLFVDGYAHTGGVHARQECTRRFNMTKGTSNRRFILCIYLDRKYGSGNALLNVRADLRLRLMLVLRFNVDESSTNILSPVKQKLHLRLKILNPRRHRPIRQPRGAPVVLSECDKEDPRCLWRGQLFLVARRPRWRYHPCLLHYKCRIRIMRPFSILKVKCFHLSHLFDFSVVAQKLQPLLGGKFPTFVLCFHV